MLSKISVDEVFMHYFKTCRQLLGDFPPYLTGAPPLDPESLSLFYYYFCFLINVVYSLSVDKLCCLQSQRRHMHYFQNMSSAYGALLPDSHRGSAPGLRWGTSVFPLICPPIKNILRRPCQFSSRLLLQLQCCTSDAFASDVASVFFILSLIHI